MSNPLVEDLKSQFKQGNVLIRLIIVNLAVFFIVTIIQLLLFLFNAQELSDTLIEWLAVPADITDLLFKPWTIITYMFLHEGIWHIAMNMLVLYFSGRIFMLFLSQRQLLGVYVLGGLSGAGIFLLAYNIFPLFSDSVPYAVCLGASASVISILVAAATTSPNYTVNLPFLGPVKLKYIAIFYIVMDLVNIKSGNSGGHIAHLGGALFGYYYIKQLHKGKDLSVWINKAIDTIVFYFKPKPIPKMKVAHKQTKTNQEYNTKKVNHQAQVDAILDKISKSGYDSLSKAEKDFLFQNSNNK
jgi:membrane associated rhomboid family serine protease